MTPATKLLNIESSIKLATLIQVSKIVIRIRLNKSLIPTAYLNSRVVCVFVRNKESSFGGAIVGVNGVLLVEDLLVNFEVVTVHSTVE